MYRVAAARRKTGIVRTIIFFIECSRMEFADGFVQNTGIPPSRRLPAGIATIGSGDANPYVI